MNGKPRITEAQAIADRLGADSVVIIAFDRDQVAGASYGSSKENCRLAGHWLDLLVDGIAAGKILSPRMLDYMEKNA